MSNSNNSTTRKGDPFLLNYDPTELRIASEFLSNWVPFLSRDLCRRCTRTLSNRIRSLDPYTSDADVEPIKQESSTVSTPHNVDLDESCENENHDSCDTNSLGSWKDSAEVNDNTDVLASWKEGPDGFPGAEPESTVEASTSGALRSSTPVERPRMPLETQRVKMSWADMAQEDELEAEEESELSSGQSSNGNCLSGEGTMVKEAKPKIELSRAQREYIRFTSVKRKKDFICLERVNGRIVNILDGLELHTGVFSAAEQKRIVNYVEELQEMGRKGQLKERTYTAPQKWMRGKGRITIQFGCCYNYATDKNGNPPGILKTEIVDSMPHLFKVMIRRLVSWHVVPPSSVPDSCIVNIYEEGDCIPPHIDNHDFVRPFCTVSFLSECDIVFGTNLKVVAAGEFSGAIAIPLPVGSVLVFNGNGADVAKHCVPAVPTKRISITFRRMDESKRPDGFVPESDLEGLQPLTYDTERSKKFTPSKPRHSGKKQPVRTDTRSSGHVRQAPSGGRRFRANSHS